MESTRQRQCLTGEVHQSGRHIHRPVALPARAAAREQLREKKTHDQPAGDGGSGGEEAGRRHGERARGKGSAEFLKGCEAQDTSSRACATLVGRSAAYMQRKGG